MSPLAAWTVIGLFWLAPLVHVLVSPRSGGWRPPEGSRCPIGPRAGWAVLTAAFGIFGWLLFIRWLRRQPAV